jgi:hypothetical protein
MDSWALSTHEKAFLASKKASGTQTSKGMIVENL